MKKILLCMLLAAASHIAVAQQWDPEVNLMPNDYGSSWTTGNNAHSLAVKGDTVFLVWYNATDTNINTGHQVFFKLYDGLNWLTTREISQGTNWRRHSWYPSCALSPAGDLYVVWETNDNGASVYDVVFRRYSNGIWSGTTQITNNDVAGYSWHPSVGCGSDGKVHFVWQDNCLGSFKIFYKWLQGSSWSKSICLASDGVYSGLPTIAISGNDASVAWQDFREGICQIYFTKQEGGVWSSVDSAISHSSKGAYAPCMVADKAGNLHVVWEDLRDGNFEIYYRRFSAQNRSWNAEMRLTDDPYYSRQPVLACGSDTLLYLFWADDRQGAYEIYSRKMMNNAWGPETTLTVFDRRTSLAPAAAVDENGNVHLAWSDNREWYAMSDIFYKFGSGGKTEAECSDFAGRKISWLSSYPNPVRSNSTLMFHLSESQRTSIKIYNIAGQLVRNLYDGEAAGGVVSLPWDGCDQSGCKVASGVYLVKMQAARSTATGKILVLR